MVTAQTFSSFTTDNIAAAASAVYLRAPKAAAGLQPATFALSLSAYKPNFNMLEHVVSFCLKYFGTVCTVMINKDRRQYNWDVRQETRGIRCETGDFRQWDRRHETGDVRLEIWDRLNEDACSAVQARHQEQQLTAHAPYTCKQAVHGLQMLTACAVGANCACVVYLYAWYLKEHLHDGQLAIPGCPHQCRPVTRHRLVHPATHASCTVHFVSVGGSGSRRIHLLLADTDPT